MEGTLEMIYFNLLILPLVKLRLRAEYCPRSQTEPGLELLTQEVASYGENV